ncbi:hypothetical protein HDU80_003633 [Chytriomyces hyalinus]|nr:hypothetical protein HDU80_003633 [Chytriomyces hyalinus]
MIRFNPRAHLLLAISDSNTGAVDASACVCEWSVSNGAVSILPLARIPESAPVKCVDWAFDNASQEYRFAFGSSTGRVATALFDHGAAATAAVDNLEPTSSISPNISFNHNKSSIGSIKVTAEFVARPVRPCSLVAFCPSQSNLLLAGLGKFRNEACLLVWDTATASSSSPKTSFIAQFAISESVNSAAWFPVSGASTPATFAAGISSKWIRIYDIRSPTSNTDPTSSNITDSSSTPSIVIATKAVNSIVTDPFDNRRFASHAPGSSDVLIWDTRNTNIPCCTLTAKNSASIFSSEQATMGNNWVNGAINSTASVPAQQQPVITSLEFHPSKRGVLSACCGKDGGAYVWDLREGVPMDSTAEQSPKGDPDYTLEAGKSTKEDKVQFDQPPYRDHSTSSAAPNTLTQERNDSSNSELLDVKDQTAQAVPERSSIYTVPIIVRERAVRIDVSVVSMASSANASYTVQGLKVGLKDSKLPGNPAAVTAVANKDRSSNLVPSSSNSSLSSVSTSTAGGSSSTAQPLPSSSSSSAIPQIAALAWLPDTIGGTHVSMNSDALLAMNAREELLKIVRVERDAQVAWGCHAAGTEISCAFGGAGRSIQTFGAGQLRSTDSRSDAVEETLFELDMGILIRERALGGYGMDVDENISLLRRVQATRSSQQALHAWNWFKEQNSKQTLHSFQDKTFAFDGINNLVSEGIQAQSVSSLLTVGQNRLSKTNEEGDASLTAGAMYFEPHPLSEFRVVGMRMCDRFFETDVWLEGKIRWHEQNGAFEMAAGMALFYSSSIERGLTSLNSAKDEKLKLVSAALTGHLNAPVGTVKGGWTEALFSSLARDLEDPYLRAVFTVFSSEGDWNLVLETEGLPLADRIGIALRFLNDSELAVYLEKLTARVVKTGDLEGLMLTGLSTRAGFDLLESFIDVTSDFQTASLLAVCGAIGGAPEDSRVNEWIECYRTILDRFGMFHERAHFDISRTKWLRSCKMPVPAAPPSQMHLRCNFCNGVISGATTASTMNAASPGNAGSAVKKLTGVIGVVGGGGGGAGGAGGNGVVGGAGSGMLGGLSASSSCPHCKKPLPRCSLCLMHLGAGVVGEDVDMGDMQGMLGTGLKFMTCVL